MKRKIIIEIKNDAVTDLQAIGYIRDVINDGKISSVMGKPQYCFITQFKDGITVYTKENYNTETDRFVIL